MGPAGKAQEGSSVLERKDRSAQGRAITEKRIMHTSRLKVFPHSEGKKAPKGIVHKGFFHKNGNS
eukprot:5257844-Amphidinium_carterae.1